MIALCGSTVPTPSAALVVPSQARGESAPARRLGCFVDCGRSAASQARASLKARITVPPERPSDTAFRSGASTGPRWRAGRDFDSRAALTLRAEAPAADTIILRPSAALTPGTTYRFKLRRRMARLARRVAVTAARPRTSSARYPMTGD